MFTESCEYDQLLNFIFMFSICICHTVFVMLKHSQVLCNNIVYWNDITNTNFFLGCDDGVVYRCRLCFSGSWSTDIGYFIPTVWAPGHFHRHGGPHGLHHHLHTPCLLQTSAIHSLCWHHQSTTAMRNNFIYFVWSCSSLTICIIS